MVRVLICHCAGSPGSLSLPKTRGLRVVRCSKHETLLEELVKDPPQVVVYCLRADWREDVRVLRLVRRIAPQLPLVILGPVSSLEIREEVQGLRPIYFGVTPVEPAELEGAVQAAAGRSR